MGALHAGHGKLIDQARLECPYGVVSIFVNPLQFGPREDFELYPRSLKKDLEFSEAHQADLVFAPGVRDMHPKEQGMYVDIGPEGRHLCGPFRPGHFRAWPPSC